MLSKAQKTRLGAFIIFGSALLLLITVGVAGNRLMDKKDIYYISFENYSVRGLQVGGTVNYRGIKVGRVENIKIDPKDVSKVIITISVDRGTPIKADTEATLVFVGITGVKAVELSGGSNQAAALKPKSFIKIGSTMIDDISDRALSIAEKIDLIASNINNLTDEENRRNIAQILHQTSMILDDTRQNLSTTMASLSMVAQNTALATAGLNNNINRITDSFVQNIDELTQKSTGSIVGIADNVNLSMNKMTDEVARKLDVLTSSATGSLDSITVATTKGLRAITSSTTGNLDRIGLSAKSSIENLVAQLNKELDSISKNLDNSIKDINTNTQALLVDTRKQVNDIGTNSNELILGTSRQIVELSAQINRSLQRVNGILESAELEGIVNNLNTLSGQLADANMKNLVNELTVTLNKASNAISTIDRTLLRNRSNINEIMETLREASSNLNEFSRQIADQPAVIFRGN